MEYADILSKWAEYTNYNPTQTAFNLANYSYEFHEVNKKIGNILKIYDETGALAIIQAKIMFSKVLKNSTYNAYELMKNPAIVKKKRKCGTCFTAMRSSK